jgi:hypothetical protein
MSSSTQRFRTSLNRRQLLRATGLGAGSLFLPSLAGKRPAHAQTPPTRLVIFYTQHGPVYDQWRMRRPGLPETDADWEFPLDDPSETSFSETLRPLHPHRKDLLILDGLAITSAFADAPGTNNHNAGTSHMLSAAKMVRDAGFNGEGQGGGASVDQIVAGAVAQPGQIKSLLYSSAYRPWCPSFEGSNRPTAAEYSPSAAFDRLFPGGAAPGTTPTPADLIKRERASVLDLVRKEYTTLAPRLGTDDRQKLERHRDLIADLQAQLAGRGSIACAAPARPGVSGNDGGTNVNPRTRPFMQLVTAAMSCDLTRVATIVVGQLATADFGGPSGVDVHQAIAHEATPGSAAAGHMTSYYKLHAADFAYLIGLFGSAGLLASTALVWVNELANGPHDMYRIMVVLAGGAGGAFRTGRYLKYKETGANPATFTYGGGRQRLGPAHSKLLVSLMQAMGLPNNSIGISAATGSLAGSGEAVDLVGPLPRLR